MTTAELRFDATIDGPSQAPAIQRLGVSDVLVALANLSMDSLVGTGDQSTVAQRIHSLVAQDSWTNSGVTRHDRVPSPRPTATALHEIKQLTRLTWTQLATFLGVDRRSVHAWAVGGRMAAGREEQLYRLLDIARANTGETPDQARRAVFEAVDLMQDDQPASIRKLGVPRDTHARRSRQPHFLDLMADPDQL